MEGDVTRVMSSLAMVNGYQMVPSLDTSPRCHFRFPPAKSLKMKWRPLSGNMDLRLWFAVHRPAQQAVLAASLRRAMVFLRKNRAKLKLKGR